MKILSLIVAISIVSPANAATLNYDCTLNAPQVFSVSDGKVSAEAIEGLPREALSFGLKLNDKNAEIDWPESPLQMLGKTVVFATGPNAGAALFLSAGPCLFTEAACGSMLNYAVQPDKSVNVLITPTAIATDEASKTRNPFLVSIEGKCLPGNGKQ